MLKKKKIHKTHKDFMQHLSESWESVDFPLISLISKNSLLNNWESRTLTLSALKILLHNHNLRMYEDYVIVTNPEYKEKRSLTVKFKEEGAGLILLIQWLAYAEKRGAK